jgi:hypothetical protein
VLCEAPQLLEESHFLQVAYTGQLGGIYEGLGGGGGVVVVVVVVVCCLLLLFLFLFYF